MIERCHGDDTLSQWPLLDLSDSFSCVCRFQTCWDTHRFIFLSVSFMMSSTDLWVCQSLGCAHHVCSVLPDDPVSFVYLCSSVPAFSLCVYAPLCLRLRLCLGLTRHSGSLLYVWLSWHPYRCTVTDYQPGQQRSCCDSKRNLKNALNARHLAFAERGNREISTI